MIKAMTKPLYNDTKAIIKLFAEAEELAVYIHVSPDGDAISCAISIYRALTPVGKKVHLISSDDIPNKYSFYPESALFEKPGRAGYDLAVAVDCCDINRLGAGSISFLKSKSRVVIDHHKSHQKFGQANLVIPNTASCAEVLYHLLDDMKLITKPVAEAIFCGIVSDSGCFQFSSTTADTHAVVAKLIEYGIDSSGLVYKVWREVSPAVFNLKNRILSACKFYEKGKIAIITFRSSDFEATGTTHSDTDGIIAYPLDVTGVEVAFSISEVAKHSFKISIRTKDYVDASDIALVFGGGGHTHAAGCRINGFYEDIVEKLLKAAKDKLN